MSKSLLDTFVSTPPRETAGSRSANRFDFQKNWSLCKLLRLHSEEDSYLIVFDLHEDVVIFDSEYNPSKSKYYQIKTKASGNWTIKALSKKDKKSKSSILGKLYTAHELFRDSVLGLYFISNQSFRVRLRESTKSELIEETEFDDLCSDEKKLIRNTTHDDTASISDIEGLSKVKLQKCALSHINHRAETKGQIVEFFEDQFPEYEINASLAYKTLFDEIVRKTNHERPCQDIDDLKLNKAIGKSGFSEILKVLLSSRSRQQIWNEIDNALGHEGCSAIRRKNIREAWQDFFVDDMDSINEKVTRFKQKVTSLLIERLEDGYDGDLIPLVEEIFSDSDVAKFGYTKDYTAAVVLMEVIGNVEFQKTDKKSKDEEQ